MSIMNLTCSLDSYCKNDFVTTVGCGAGNNCGRGIFSHAISDFRRKGCELAHEDAFKVSYYPFYAIHEMRVGSNVRAYQSPRLRALEE
jgi:hypothetical protein